jgi:hypothetical protein
MHVSADARRAMLMERNRKSKFSAPLELRFAGTEPSILGMERSCYSKIEMQIWRISAWQVKARLHHELMYSPTRFQPKRS